MAHRPDPDKERRWLDLVNQWRRSQLTVREFCRQQRLGEPNFHAWRRVLRQRGLLSVDEAAKSSKRPAFLKVAVDDGRAVTDSDPALAALAAIDIVLAAGRTLRVRPGFDSDMLRQLVRLLEEP